VFGIRARDRRSHIYILGKTGTGKSHLLRTMMSQDVVAGEGCALLDPHGQLAREVREHVPAHRRQDLVYVNPADTLSLWRFNPLANVAEAGRAFAAAGIVETFKKLWSDDWGPRLEHVLRNVVFALLATPASSFADIPALLTDRTYRSTIVSQLADPVVRAFWEDEFEHYSQGFKSMIIAPLQNKVGAILTDPVSRRFFTEPGRAIDMRSLMDEGKILVVNLDKGAVGEGPSALIGSLLLSHIALASLSRSAQPEERRRDFWIYADEFQTFTTLSLANMLAELRKYRVGLTLANQHLSQLDPAIRDAIFGNVGSLLSLRTGAADAAYLVREFGGVFAASDFTNLERYHIYMRLLIDGVQSRAFSATTLS
jgi:DNA helicase HerA-like ATPase